MPILNLKSLFEDEEWYLKSLNIHSFFTCILASLLYLCTTVSELACLRHESKQVYNCKELPHLLQQHPQLHV